MQIDKRIEDLEAAAREILAEEGITTTDPWQAIDAVPQGDRYLGAAAYILLLAQGVRDEFRKLEKSLYLPAEMKQQGYDERRVKLAEGSLQSSARRAAEKAMDIERQWHDIQILQHYDRDLAVRRGGRLYHVDEISHHDIVTGSRRNVQVREFADRGNGPRHQEAEARRQRWRDADEQLRSERPRLNSKLERARKIKERLGESVSADTISRALPRL